MRGGIILIVVGLLLGFLAVSGKLCCLNNLWACAVSPSDKPCECGSGGQSAPQAPQKTPSVFDQLQELLRDGLGVYP